MDELRNLIYSQRTYVREDGPKRGLFRRGSKESLPRNVATQWWLGAECLGQLLTNIATEKSITLVTANNGTSHDVLCDDNGAGLDGGFVPLRLPSSLPISSGSSSTAMSDLSLFLSLAFSVIEGGKNG